ncbi:uncharacterized protein LOC131438653 isoform X2 [Malaya genurostris]|uniref:uncharacterized protein LOC131425241 isoform X2 n=1 Tax=Malaya genurostris TaxID=325434 RepID=UPI0026F3C2A9|nr:uncharacterized protein LOC131425241 isoform X2 [Malaya genurostris]XP_058464791.1 uncharacterized protein LOC131438653 isoform X2 [Malaya genurostris]
MNLQQHCITPAEGSIDHIEVIENIKYSIEESNDSSEGIVDGLNDFSITQYFEKIRVDTLLSDDECSDIGFIESSSSETGDAVSKNQKDQKKKSQTWIVRKRLKECGKPYKRSDGTVVSARCIKANCNCFRLKCFEQYTDKIRTSILKQFLKLRTSGQNQFISNHVLVKPVHGSRVLNSRRTFTRIYHLPALNGRRRVCKKMFQNTLDIKDKKVRWLSEKTIANGGMCPDDERTQSRNPCVLSDSQIKFIKDHISSFPSCDSHYSREKSSKVFLSSDLSVAKMFDLFKELCLMKNLPIVSYSTYHKIFKQMNLSFRKPRVDTCNYCDELQIRRRLAVDPIDRESIESDLETHQKRGEAIFEKKRFDIKESRESCDICTFSFDLQKALATPHLSCGQVYYLRQMYTYNLTIFASCGNINKSYCYLWDEGKARRGANEIGSCLLKFIHALPQNIKIVNCYSDRCFGQNHNIVICSTFMALIDQFRKQGRDLKITHNFMQSGHSHMEVDSVHSCIERAKKKSNVQIEVPRDWAIFISSIRRKQPLVVYTMEQKDFLNLKQLDKYYKKPTMDCDNKKISFQKIMCFQYCTFNENLLYKYDIRDQSWSQMSLYKSNSGFVILPGPITLEPLPLPEAKLEDLRKMMKFVSNKKYYETFLKELTPKKRGRRQILRTLDHFEADLDVFHEEELEDLNAL